MTRAAFPMLAGLTFLAWLLPAWEYARMGAVSVMSVVTALMLTTMLIVWPLMTGRRVHRAHVERAFACRDCHALRWPGDLDFGFCIHCGSTRVALATL